MIIINIIHRKADHLTLHRKYDYYKYNISFYIIYSWYSAVSNASIHCMRLIMKRYIGCASHSNPIKKYTLTSTSIMSETRRCMPGSTLWITSLLSLLIQNERITLTNLGKKCFGPCPKMKTFQLVPLWGLK